MRRREFLQTTAYGAAGFMLAPSAPAYAWTDTKVAALRPQSAPDGEVDLVIDEMPFVVNGRRGNAIALNGSVPGPLLRLRQGQDAVIRVNNRLKEASSIHWHGVILPKDMDGVPGVSFAGIPPQSTFTYRFEVLQSGTYWAHSHSGGQELLGLYFPLIIDPLDPEPFQYDRDYVVMLSDWSFESPAKIIANLKRVPGYYNFQRRTMGDFIGDVRRDGFGSTIGDRLEWSKMRMDPTDFADVTGYTYTYLMNGLTPAANWTGLFRPGERVRLRFINAGAMTYFDVRIPGLKMAVVQADGQNVAPVEIDEFRIGGGETYDVIVHPQGRAYTVFAESLDRSGYTRGTLAPRPGMTAALPPRRPRPLRTMADMGMSGMDHSQHSEKPAADTGEHDSHTAHAIEEIRHQILERRDPDHQTPQHNHEMVRSAGPVLPGSPPVMHAPDTHGPGNSAVPMASRSRLDDPGSGFEGVEGKVLVYTDLQSLTPHSDRRDPEREIELHITGNMERYMWSFDGKKYSEAKTPIPFRYGERLRLILVNDTMMEHPIHLHGMWMDLENGHGVHQPRKHTISVKPAERLSVAITADAPGQWALHCHLLLHMELGMFRVVEVSPGPEGRL